MIARRSDLRSLATPPAPAARPVSPVPRRSLPSAISAWALR